MAAATQIEHIPPDRLRPWEKNARTHSRKQVRQIADSIRAFGFTNPVLIDEGTTILAGHGRVAAAKLIGMDTVPCLRFATMTAAQKRAYVIADNKLALNAGWDEDLLAGELAGAARHRRRLRRVAHGVRAGGGRRADRGRGAGGAGRSRRRDRR